MRLGNAFRDFWGDVRNQRLRTALTILGITWGTVAVVVLLAFGVGFKTQTMKRFHGLGDGIVIVFGGRTTKSFQGFPEGRYIRFREEDATILAREIPDIADISPEYLNRGTPVRRGTNIALPAITGIYPVYGVMRNVIPQPGGRFINELDMEGRRRVIVLGDAIKQLLFADDSAVGRIVYVGETPFTVIGVMEHKTQNSSYNSRDQDRAFIPASTYAAMFGDRHLADLIYRPRTPAVSKATQRRLYEVLGRRYRFDPDDKDALMVWDTNQFEKMIGVIFVALNSFLGIVGAFTLTVGGIGVANIMYVVVKERTREIGIRRSVGARRRDILTQFLGHTFVIVAVGAVLGFLISVGLAKAMTFIPIKEFVGVPHISPLVGTVTFGLLAAIAFIAGLFPARKAANLDPIECLRY